MRLWSSLNSKCPLNKQQHGEDQRIAIIQIQRLQTDQVHASASWQNMVCQLPWNISPQYRIKRPFEGKPAVSKLFGSYRHSFRIGKSTIEQIFTWRKIKNRYKSHFLSILIQNSIAQKGAASTPLCATKKDQTHNFRPAKWYRVFDHPINQNYVFTRERFCEWFRILFSLTMANNSDDRSLKLW